MGQGKIENLASISIELGLSELVGSILIIFLFHIPRVNYSIILRMPILSLQYYGIEIGVRSLWVWLLIRGLFLIWLEVSSSN